MNIFLDTPDYQFNLMAPNFPEQILEMTEGTTAEIFSETDGAFMQKFVPTSYALAKKTGMIDLEIVCGGDTEIAYQIQEALKSIADARGIDDLMVYSNGMKSVHLYFYPKGNKDG